MVHVKMFSFNQEAIKLVSTDDLVAVPKPYEDSQKVRSGYFLGRLVPSFHSGEVYGYPVKLYSVTYSCIVDVEHPRSTWATGSSPIWQIIRWVDLNIEVLGESSPDDTSGSV
jgi:hypothetical protein